jgi:hypothetical protein
VTEPITLKNLREMGYNCITVQTLYMDGLPLRGKPEGKIPLRIPRHK